MKSHYIVLHQRSFEYVQFLLIGSFISWNSIMQKNSFSVSTSCCSLSTTLCTLWKYSFFSSSSSLFFFVISEFYTFYVFYAIDKIFNLRMAFSIQGSVYLCKNETIEICCMATRYSETSSIKTEYTIFFISSFILFFNMQRRCCSHKKSRETWNLIAGQFLSFPLIIVNALSKLIILQLVPLHNLIIFITTEQKQKKNWEAKKFSWLRSIKTWYLLYIVCTTETNQYINNITSKAWWRRTILSK